MFFFTRRIFSFTFLFLGLDLVQMGADVEKEKDRLLEVFLDWAHAVCKKLRDAGHWADFIDPCSGKH
jgi:hypothetical protein